MWDETGHASRRIYTFPSLPRITQLALIGSTKSSVQIHLSLRRKMFPPAVEQPLTTASVRSQAKESHLVTAGTAMCSAPTQNKPLGAEGLNFMQGLVPMNTQSFVCQIWRKPITWVEASFLFGGINGADLCVCSNIK